MTQTGKEINAVEIPARNLLNNTHLEDPTQATGLTLQWIWIRQILTGGSAWNWPWMVTGDFYVNTSRDEPSEERVQIDPISSQ